MGIVAAGIGAVGAIGGSIIQSKAADKAAKRAAAAAEFNPWNISTGNVSAGMQTDKFGNPIDGKFQGTLTQPLASAQAAANVGVEGGLLAGPGQGAIDRQFQGDRFEQGTLLAGQGLNQFGQQATAQDQLLAGQQGQLGQGLADFQQQNQQAQGLVGGTSQFAAQRGQEMLGQNFGDVRASELDLLRRQARPGEDRAVNAKFQNLFSRGQLGTTGGANQIGALASAQENADINRQLAATQTAQGLQSMNQATGQGLLGLGQQGGALQGNLASQNLGAIGSTVGQQGTIGQTRMGNLQGMFGFGQDVRGLGLEESKQNLGISTALESENRAAINLGGTFGGAEATAGGNVANALLSNSGSPVGGAISSFGQSLLQQGLSNIGTGGSSPELQQITLPDSAVRRS
jgi:hypothetical protein